MEWIRTERQAKLILIRLRHSCPLSLHNVNSARGFLWFVALLYPYMAFGLLCSTAAQFLVEQASNPNGAPLDVVDFPDLKSIHGFVGTILGFTISIRTSRCVR